MWTAQDGPSSSGSSALTGTDSSWWWGSGGPDRSFNRLHTNTHFFIDPEEDVIGFFMTQSAFLATRQQLRDDFETAVMQALVDDAAAH